MDPISDMIIQIKNAGSAGKESVLISYSQFKHAVASVLLREGYVVSVNKRRGKRGQQALEIGIAYGDAGPKIKGLKRLSKPSCRRYVGSRAIYPVRQGFGNLILSTPKGVLTGIEARKQKVGGEALFEIW